MASYYQDKLDHPIDRKKLIALLLSSSSVSDKRDGVLRSRCGRKFRYLFWKGKLLQALLVALNSSDEHGSREVAHAIVFGGKRMRKLMIRWMLDEKESEENRVMAIEDLRGPFYYYDCDLDDYDSGSEYAFAGTPTETEGIWAETNKDYSATENTRMDDYDSGSEYAFAGKPSETEGIWAETNKDYSATKNTRMDNDDGINDLNNEHSYTDNTHDPPSQDHNGLFDKQWETHEEPNEVQISHDDPQEEDCGIAAPSDAELWEWETVARDKNPRVAAAATEAMLGQSRYHPELFPFFMKWLLNSSVEQDILTGEFSSRWSGWYTPWLPFEDATEVWDKVPAESLAVVAQVLRRYRLREDSRRCREAGTAVMILQRAPNLTLNTMDILVELWYDIDKEDIWVNRVAVMSIIAPHAQIPSKALDTAIAYLETEFMEQNPSPTDSSSYRVLELCFQLCVNQMKHGNLGTDVIAKLLNSNNNDKLGWSNLALLGELVDQHVEVQLIPLLQTGPLTALFSIYFEPSEEMDVSFVRHSGLLLYFRNGSSAGLDMGSEERICEVMELFEAVKLEVAANPRGPRGEILLKVERRAV